MKVYLVLLNIGIVLFAVSCGFGSRYGTDGEAIFMEGKTKDGKAAGNTVDRDALQNKEMTLSCAGCHGEDAGGRKNPIPEFGPYIAPPITWNALTAASRTTPYTEETFALAVNEGLSPEGYRLHHPMPRWELSNGQIRELIAYLQTK